jgi:predicted nuclease of predicted toxin-antitoxin system
MKILLDEMYTGLKELLKAMNWEVTTVPECGLQGKEDREVAKYAYDHELLLVTQDSLPAEIVDVLGGWYVLVRPKDVAQIVDKMILEKYPELKKDQLLSEHSAH